MSFIAMGNTHPALWAKKTLIAQSVELAVRK
jgi:hypothetical protein